MGPPTPSPTMMLAINGVGPAVLLSSSVPLMTKVTARDGVGSGRPAFAPFPRLSCRRPVVGDGCRRVIAAADDLSVQNQVAGIRADVGKTIVGVVRDVSDVDLAGDRVDARDVAQDTGVHRLGGSPVQKAAGHVVVGVEEDDVVVVDQLHASGETPSNLQHRAQVARER